MLFYISSSSFLQRKLQVSDQDLAKTQTLRYYDESKLRSTDRDWKKKKSQSAALLRATQKQKQKQKLQSGPTLLKLHHKLKDGSSTI